MSSAGDMAEPWMNGCQAAHGNGNGQDPAPSSCRVPCNGPIRMLRLAQVLDATGLGKTKIYELQARGDFPMRVKITSHSVGWVEEEVQAWLARRIAISNSSITV